MAVALIGYFTTMVAVFAGLMVMLTTFLPAAPREHANLQPHPRPAIAQSLADERFSRAQSVAVKAEIAAKPTIAAKPEIAERKFAAPTSATVRADVAKPQRTKPVQNHGYAGSGRQPAQGEFTWALGYNQEPADRPAFDPIASRRF